MFSVGSFSCVFSVRSDEGRDDPNTPKSGPSLSQRVSLVSLLWSNINCWLGGFVPIFQRIWTSIAKKNCDFQGGGGPDPCPSLLDPRMNMTSRPFDTALFIKSILHTMQTLISYHMALSD